MAAAHNKLICHRQFGALFLCFLYLFAGDRTDGFRFVADDQEMVYEYVGNITVGAQAPMDTTNAAPPPASGWLIRGTLKLQRIDNATLAASLAVEKVILFGSARIFYQNKEMQPVYNPFKVVFGSDDLVTKVKFKTKDPVWSRNFKRAIAFAIQLQGIRTGAFVAHEPSINGNCSTEYYVSRPTNQTITVKKTSELNSCQPFPGGIHFERSNVPVNPCEFDFQKNVIVGNEAVYELDVPRPDSADQTFHLKSAHVTGLTMVQTFESTGEAQYISSDLQLTFHSLSDGIVNRLDVERDMDSSTIGLELQDLDHDATGGRQPMAQDELIKDITAIFGEMVDNLENCYLNFEEPYDNRVAEIIQMLGNMDIHSLRLMFQEFDIGTSYRQETIRNLFFQILPRIGTSASVRLTKELITTNSVLSSTAIPLLVSMPFHVFELSRELVEDCEELLNLGISRPDVSEAAYLSFATLVYNAYNTKTIERNDFEKYVKLYYELFAKSTVYERKIVYLQGLGNLLLGNVADYLDPVIRDESVDTDTRFMAILATMPLVRNRAENVYETFWPMFQNRNNSLELRVISFYTLILSYPTPARLMSLHNVLRHETDPHLINFYRTTILSMSGTTHPCYQDLKRLLSYMSRHIPKSQSSRYWATGQYLYDYRDQQYGIGAMLQSILIGDTKTNKPYIGIVEFQTEALGKFSSQLTLIVKARGVSDKIFERYQFNRPKDIFPQIVKMMQKLRLPTIQTTPFHLEIVVKSENKFILSFLVNERTIQNLSQQEIISRIFNSLLSNSHINMQTIRWPFMLKYAVPTVLGTPAQITIQSTVLASLRGNITQVFVDQQETSRSHQVDARYSSYAVCKSTTYNPFLNLEHTINREQGFLVYIPINNEMDRVRGESLNISFNRPANLTSGASLKSRSMTSTKGVILPTDHAPFEELLRPDKSQMVPVFRYELADIGLNVTAESTLIDLTNHLAFLFQSDIKENTKVLLGKNSIMDTMIMFAGILQLNAMHIGNNKNFAILLHNEKNTKMDATFWNIDSYNELFLRLAHTSERTKLHSWDFEVNLRNLYEVPFKLMFENYGIVLNVSEKMVIEGVFEQLVFLKRPYSIQGKAEFGTNHPDGPAKSHVDFKLTAGHSDNSIDLYNTPPHPSDKTCPRKILLFHPPPAMKSCDPDTFANISMLTKYTVDMKVANMSKLYDNLIQRVEHFASTFQGRHGIALNLSSTITARLDVQPGDLTMNLALNNEQFVFPNVLRYLRQLKDVKYDTLPYYSIEYGLTTMCSAINGKLSSFNDAIIQLDVVDIGTAATDNTSSNATSTDNCPVLLLSKCSDDSEFAVFLQKLPCDRYAFKLFHRGAFIEYAPSDEASSKVITVNGKDTVPLTESRFKVSDITASINQDGNLVVWLDYKLMLQYDMHSIFTIQTINVEKDRVCGLCNAPINPMASYMVCNA